jgi:ABC-type sulfate transport system permease component
LPELCSEIFLLFPSLPALVIGYDLTSIAKTSGTLGRMSLMLAILVAQACISSPYSEDGDRRKAV